MRPGGLALYAVLAGQGLRESRATTALLVLAVAAGEAFQLPNTANIAGYDAELLAQGVTAGWGEVRVRPREGARFADGDAIAARAAEVPGVRAAVPVLVVPGALVARGRSISAPVLGVDARAERPPFALLDGDRPRARARDEVVVGRLLASRLGIATGARVDVRLVLDHPPPVDANAPPGATGARVTGLARGVFTSDEAAVVDRAFLGPEIGEPGAASLVVVRSDAPFEAERLARAVERALGPAVEVRAWSEDSTFLASAIRGNRALNAISSAMALVGVAIPVWALLYVSVARRRREIALYGALGFSAAEIFAIFLLQAVTVGLAGTGLGALLGLGVVRWFDAHPLFSDPGFTIRPVLRLADLAWTAALLFATTVAAALVPALRAARVDPAGALRGGP